MMLAVARRGLAAAINDAENGIGHLSCDDPQIMEQARAHWRRLYDTYLTSLPPEGGRFRGSRPGFSVRLAKGKEATLARGRL